MKQPETKQEKTKYEPPFLSDIPPLTTIKGDDAGDSPNINFGDDDD